MLIAPFYLLPPEDVSASVYIVQRLYTLRAPFNTATLMK